MLTINLIVMGKLSEKFYADAVKEYAKRLSAYCRLNITELPEKKIYNEGSSAEITAALDEEAQRISKYTEKGVTVAMCVEGKQYSSEEFAELISDCALRGESVINFVIGSSHGLAESLKRKSNYRISVSKMTLPHQLCRVVLTEQIFRAFKINANEKYHK